MISKLIGWCIDNRFMVVILTAIMTVVGVWSTYTIPVDAIPDLSDVQVIIYTPWQGRDPQTMEDQVTYPLARKMLSVPGLADVRGYSFFGFSFVYVIFEDGTDMYWARSRVLEYLSEAEGELPDGAAPQLGPDATGLGWVYIYTLEDTENKYNLGELRAVQDWYVRYQLQSVPGVSEVATVGGAVRQYQVEVDPQKLLFYQIPLQEVVAAIKDSNNDVGGRLVELAETEHMIRGRGYIRSKEDIEKIVLSATLEGTPVLLSDVADVQIGPDMKRGIAEKNGEGEVVAGIVVMRFGENALTVIEGVKDKIEEIEGGLPEGVRIRTAYDRSGLINRSIDTLKVTLTEELAITAIICLIFLLHVRSGLVAAAVLPLGILLAFIVMKFIGLNANIMSISGIAVAIGAMVETHASLRAEEDWPKRLIEKGFLQSLAAEMFADLRTGDFLTAAGNELSTATIAEQTEGMTRADVNRQTRMELVAAMNAGIKKFRQGLEEHREEALERGEAVASRFSEEKLEETWAGKLLRRCVERIRPRLPQRVVDGLSQNLVDIIESQGGIDEERKRAAVAQLREQWRGRITATEIPLVQTTFAELTKQEMHKAITIPGMPKWWLMPIETRIGMLTTGMRGLLGLKVYGTDLEQLEEVGLQLESVLKEVPGTVSVVAERPMGGKYLDIEVDRDACARYGLKVGDVQRLVETAIGGVNIDSTVEGRYRFPISVRYLRELRDDPEKLKRILIAAPRGRGRAMDVEPADGDTRSDVTRSTGTSSSRLIPLGQVARIEVADGPPMIKSEAGMLLINVPVDIEEGLDIGTYVKNAKDEIERARTDGRPDTCSCTKFLAGEDSYILLTVKRGGKMKVEIKSLENMVLDRREFEAPTIP